METKELVRGFLGAYLQQKGLPLQRNFRCLNPEHEDVHPSMGYHAASQTVRCFACGKAYDIFDLVGMDYGLERFSDQLEKACALFGVEAPGRQEPARILPEASPAAGDRSRELAELFAGRDGDDGYFQRRGIASEQVEARGLFCRDGRAYFPVWERGICTGWSARALDDAAQPRYRNSSGPDRYGPSLEAFLKNKHYFGAILIGIRKKA